MTIEKGEPWGEQVSRPSDLRIAEDDAELARLLSDGTGIATAVESGDMFRTLGARPLEDRSDLIRFPIDLVHVQCDDHRFTVVSHLVVRRPFARGGALRGPVLAVMNAEWIGRFDVAPRGHPNDGRVETFLGSEDLTVRERLAVRSRLATATHIPHPKIATRPVRSAEWEFDRPMDLLADGRSACRVRRLRIDVEPDANVLFA